MNKLMRNGPEPTNDLDGFTQRHALAQKERRILEEFEVFSQMEIYNLLCQMAADDEEEATENLIKTDELSVANIHRATIQRCRYFNEWALSLGEALIESRTYTDPPE